MLNFGQKCSSLATNAQKTKCHLFFKNLEPPFFQKKTAVFVPDVQLWLKMLKFRQKCSILAKSAQIGRQMLRKPNTTFFSKIQCRLFFKCICSKNVISLQSKNSLLQRCLSWLISKRAERSENPPLCSKMLKFGQKCSSLLKNAQV